jgi:hypothetical protein
MFPQAVGLREFCFRRARLLEREYVGEIQEEILEQVDI